MTVVTPVISDSASEAAPTVEKPSISTAKIVRFVRILGLFGLRTPPEGWQYWCILHILSGSQCGVAAVPRSSKKEFRTSVILTEAQHRQVLDIARANDASIAWVLRQALDRYLGTHRVTVREREGMGSSGTTRSR